MKKYASLHGHTHYSNIRGLDSIMTEKSIIDTAFSLGLNGIAITDHDVLSGHVKAIQHYNKNYKDSNMKLILGNEIYLTREDLNKENYEKTDKLNHFLLLAKNEIGHRQLRMLSSRAWERSFMKGVMRTPTYLSDIKEIIETEGGQNIVATTSCFGGILGNFYKGSPTKDIMEIMPLLNELQNIFGVDNFYIEIQPSARKEIKNFNKYLVDNLWGIFPFVFTTDSHYAKKEDALIHKQFLQSQSKNRDVDSFYSENYLMTFDEIENSFKSYISEDKIEKMRLNTILISDSIKNYDLLSNIAVPKIPVEINGSVLLNNDLAAEAVNKMPHLTYIKKYLESKNSQDIYYLSKIMSGYKSKISTEIKEIYFERINEELEHVWESSEKLGQPVSAYFVTMEKMIDLMWEEADSLVGVSRGSAAAFLTNYLLGITQLDPLTQALPMPSWRFLHKDRPEMPDIDIDTEGSKRQKVFNSVSNYFNSIGGSLISVSTFGTEKSKSALRTAARGIGIDDDAIAYIVSLIPNERGLDWSLSQCMYGDDDNKPIQKFQEEMSKYPDLWKLSSSIEGLITRIGVHAAGVIALNDKVYEHNSVMKTSSGAIVTAFNLEDTEYAGGLKYDFLTINALDKIRTTMNLLLEDGLIEWEETLRKTYNKHLLPVNLDYTSKEMWDMVSEGKIVDLFQFDTQVGGQAVRMIKPQNIAELSVANSVMRLMTDDMELPLATYSRFKHDLRAWYSEMENAGLDDKEIKIMEKHLLNLSGVADSQESAMMIVMDPEISNFTVLEANALRKAIAKKNPVVMEQTRDKFYKHGIEQGASLNLLDYIWNVQISRQAGYSFSVLHTMGYSTIALQEMNLAYKFPVIYWNTACLSVNADAVNEEDYEILIEDGIVEIDDEEEKKSGSKVQYGKVAAALSKFRDELDVKIGLPDINRARFGFTPDSSKNEIVFGLKGIARVGDNVIRDIISHRPYANLEDFINKLNGNGKTKVSKDKVIMLIKAGAFDNLESEPRESILRRYVGMVADEKKKITLSNFNMLIKKNLVPDYLAAEIALYNFTKYIRKHKKDDMYYMLDDIALDYYYENDYDQSIIEFDVINGQNYGIIPMRYWDGIYDSGMNPVREWMSKEQSKIQYELNKELFEAEYNKYANGGIYEWELESLGFYHQGHKLDGVDSTFPNDIVISKINEIPNRDQVGVFNIKGKVIPKYNISHIIGTVIDKNKAKKTVTLSTPHGMTTIKLFQSQFSRYDQVINNVDAYGNSTVVQDSFFKKGTFLFVSGIKDGDMFLPKVYKEHGIDAILKFSINEKNQFAKAEEKL